MEYAEINNKTPSLSREGWGGSLVWWVSSWVGSLLWHPCGTRDTLKNRVHALCTKAMWHPYTLKLKISRARAIDRPLGSPF